MGKSCAEVGWRGNAKSCGGGLAKTGGAALMARMSAANGPFQRVTILGAGLLGGSVGLALRERGLAEVRFWGRSEERLGIVKEAGFSAKSDITEAVGAADLVILATPVDYFAELAEQLVALGKKFVVTDVGSVKGRVHKSAGQILQKAEIEFVGSHPMAGSERCGFSEARADLLQDAACLVTDEKQAEEKTVAKVEEFWSGLGCEVSRLGAREHDELVARISHLPHAMAAVTAYAALRKGNEHRYAGGGLRDTTRVAGGDAAMWRGIFLENREELLSELDIAAAGLSELRRLVNAEEEEGLENWLRGAQEARGRID